jgi:hypothetical protein
MLTLVLVNLVPRADPTDRYALPYQQRQGRSFR